MGDLGAMNQKKTVMHIEDNFENRMLVRRLLQSDGYDVIEAENATNALKILASARPDLILMDINMPDVDGYTLTNQLKNQETTAQIPILAITANVMRGDRERTLEAGCDGYIEKPIDIDLFLEQIAKFTNRAD